MKPTRLLAPLSLLLSLSALALPPSTQWQEQVAPDEAEVFAGYAAEIQDLQEHNRKANQGTLRRGFHAKGHAGLRGELRVLPDLPEPARHGLFAQPGSYQALVRCSSGFPFVQSDRRPDVRGFAVKVLGVAGSTLDQDAQEGPVQDLVLINHPYLPIRDAHQIMAVARASKNIATLPLKLPRIFGVEGSARATKWAVTRLLHRVRSLATEDYFSTVPVKVGPYAARIRLTHRNARAPFVTGKDYLARELTERLRGEALRWDVELQFYVSPEATPIEDASQDWDQDEAPYLKVAELTLPPQDLSSPAGRALSARVEAGRFTPWQSLEAHRPLGNMMRARRAIYEASAAYRLGQGR